MSNCPKCGQPERPWPKCVPTAADYFSFSSSAQPDYRALAAQLAGALGEVQRKLIGTTSREAFNTATDGLRAYRDAVKEKQ